MELPLGEPVDATAAERPRHVPLVGRTIELAPVEPERDAPDLYAGSHGTPEKEALWTYMPYGPFDDQEALRAWLADGKDSDDPLFLSVRAREGGRSLGIVAFLAIVPQHRTIELGHIWYTPDAQNTTVNTEAARLLLGEAFRLGYRRVEWKCHSLNARSRRAALRLGFRFEGVFRSHYIVKGRNRDTAWFSLLEEEWPAARDALDRWLDWQDGGRPGLASLRG